MTNISTKKGDQGQSSLADGTRLSKANFLFSCIGTVDELNSYLGLVVVEFKKVLKNGGWKKDKLKNKDERLQPVFHLSFLEKIQHELFTLGGELARARVRVSQGFLQEIEENSLVLQRAMRKDWHTKFVLPGGHEVAARLDVARTICRRLEREIVALIEAKESVRPEVLQLINRLSDYLYVLRCWVNLKTLQKEHFYDKSEG